MERVVRSAALRSLDSVTSLMVSVRIFIRCLVGMVTDGWLEDLFFVHTCAKVGVVPLESVGSIGRLGGDVMLDRSIGGGLLEFLIWATARYDGHLR